MERGNWGDRGIRRGALGMAIRCGSGLGEGWECEWKLGSWGRESLVSSWRPVIWEDMVVVCGSLLSQSIVESKGK